MNSFKYYNPVKIEFGSGKLNLLKNIIGNKNTLIVTQTIFKELGYVRSIQRQIKNIVFVLDDIQANPSLNALKKQYEEVWKKDFDLIVALGGGSVIDTAKVLSVYGEDKEFLFVEGLIKNPSLDTFCKAKHSGWTVSDPSSLSRHSRVNLQSKFVSRDRIYKHIPIISIPTTAGTGSEVTPWATVWDTDEKQKYSLHLPDLWSDIAVIDPEITLSMPRGLTIQTGLDALSHSLESIWNKNSNPISTDYAVRAAKLIIKTLPKIADDLSNLELREQMMFAALNAGLAFSNTKTSVAHAMSYYISAQKNIPHGLACSFSLPDIVDTVIGQDKRIDSVLHEIFGDLSSRSLRTMFAQLNVSTKVQDYGFEKTDLTAFKESMMNNQRIGNSLVDHEELFKRIF